MKKKVGMSGLNWFLAIIGLLFFASLIFLPPIFRAFMNEENTPVKEKEEQQLQTITICKKVETEKETEYVMNSKNDIIEMFAQTVTNHVADTTNMFENCNIEASLYQGISGFHHSCKIDGDKMIVESRVQIQEYKNDTIPISFNVREKASVLKTSLLDSGFECETKEK